MLCSAVAMCAATSTESMPDSGRAPCAPRPATSRSKNAPPAIIGPERTAKRPSAMPGRLCMPKSAWPGKRRNRPSSTIALAPPMPSSAGWKMKCTVPSKFRLRARCCAAPSSIAVCPSCPHACMTPSWRERCANVFASRIGSASMSARRPSVRLELPFCSTPTTPVLPMPRWTSTPKDSSCDATRSEVRFSWKPSSGWAWMSRRHSRISLWRVSGMDIFGKPVVGQFGADAHLPCLGEDRGTGGGELQPGTDVVGEAGDLRVVAPWRRLSRQQVAEVRVAAAGILPPALLLGLGRGVRRAGQDVVDLLRLLAVVHEDAVAALQHLGVELLGLDATHVHPGPQ